MASHHRRRVGTSGDDDYDDLYDDLPPSFPPGAPRRSVSMTTSPGTMSGDVGLGLGVGGVGDTGSAWRRRAPYRGGGGGSGAAGADKSGGDASSGGLVHRSKSLHDGMDPTTSSSSAAAARTGGGGQRGTYPRASRFAQHAASSFSASSYSPYDDDTDASLSTPSPHGVGLGLHSRGGGFSNRSTPVVRRSAPPHFIPSDPAAIASSDSSTGGRDADGSLLPPRPTTKWGRILYELQLLARRFLFGSPTGRDFSTLTSTTLASRIVLILLTITAAYLPTLYDAANQPPKWDYSPNRKLNKRKCVMNLYVEKQAHDEFNPDHVEVKPKKDKRGRVIKPSRKDLVQPPPTIAEGTYRTKGQMKIAGRFIEAVANSYRSNLTIAQHLIFANARDGGHLAEKALKHWPLRGNYPTQLHVVAADASGSITEEEDALGYDLLDGIEERFRGNGRVHVYDRVGLAGLAADDDMAESMDLPEGDFGREGMDDDDGVSASADGNSTDVGGGRKQRRRKFAGNKVLPYPDLRSFFPPEEDNTLVPYMHVDGEYAEDQFEILERARPLLEANTIVAISLEHSPDLVVEELIEFFNSVNYKTFFLASRQIHRLDHLCPEILDDILRHPAVAKHPALPRVHDFFLKIKHKFVSPPENPKPKQTYPPFFAAMPRGRLKKEEMTIQHMYDLFGGYGGGGGQIKTANDRKMPGK